MTTEELKNAAIEEAKVVTARTGRKHVVREDYSEYLICPMYELGREGRGVDHGYSGIGLLVKESL